MAGFGQPVATSFDWVANPAVAYAALKYLRDGDVDLVAALGSASWGTLDLELLDPDGVVAAGKKIVLDLEGDDVPSKGGHVISDDARHYVVTNRTAQPLVFEGEWFDKYDTRFTAPVVGATAPLTVAPNEVLHFTANRTALTAIQRTTAVSWQQRLINRESGSTATVTPTVTVASEAALAGVAAGPNNSFVRLDDGANPVRWFERIDGELVEQGGAGGATDTQILANLPAGAWTAFPAASGLVQISQYSVFDAAGNDITAGLPTRLAGLAVEAHSLVPLTNLTIRYTGS